MGQELKLGEAEVAKVVDALIQGRGAERVCGLLVEAVAGAYGGPIAGAAAGALVRRLARLAHDEATERFLAAGRAWDSEQQRARQLSEFFCGEVAKQFEALRQLELEASEEHVHALLAQNDEQFLQMVLYVERNMATLSGQRELLRGQREQSELLRELLGGLRMQGSAPKLPSFEGPGHVRPSPVPHFNADGELAALRELLDEQRPVSCVVIVGMGGVGKTLLAQHFVATEAERCFPDGVVWLEAATLPEDLAHAARRHGWSAPRAPSAAEAKVHLARALEAKRALLIVDDVEARAELLDALPFVAGRSRTLLTTRDVTLSQRLARRQVGNQTLSVEPWSLERCRRFLRAVVGDFSGESDESLDALGRFVGGLPLAMQLLAARPTHQRGISAAELLHALESEPISRLDQVLTDDTQLERGLVKTFMAALRRLDAETLRVLRALANCSSATSVAVVSAVSGVDPQRASAALNRLVDESLVQYERAVLAPWGMHDAIRRLVTEHAGPELAAELQAAHRRWVEEHWRQYPDAVSHALFERGTTEGMVCVDRLLSAGAFEAASEILRPLYHHLRRRGELGGVLERVARIARCPVHGLAAFWSSALGACHLMLGEIGQAEEAYRRALALEERLGNLDARALALGSLGDCARQRGELHEALSLHERALALFEQTRNRSGQAAALGGLGSVLEDLGEVPRALELHERSLKLHGELSELEGLARELGSLARCRSHLGQFDAAIQLYQRARELQRKIGDARGEAALMGDEGTCHLALGDIAHAIELHEAALALGRRFDLPLVQAAQLGNLGSCHCDLGDYDRAIELHRASQSIHRATHNVRGEIIATLNEGRCLELRGDNPDAMRLLQQLLGSLREKGFPENHTFVSQLRSVLAVLALPEAERRSLFVRRGARIDR